MQKEAYEIVLPSGKTVLLVELDIDQVMTAMDLAATGAKGSSDIRTNIESLRLSIAKIDGRDVSYSDLQGPKIKEHFNLRETMLLAGQVASLFLPTDEDQESVKNGVKAVSGA